LVDLEGGEFMHGDILDANSTNKLIDQSVKNAIDNSIENGNYVTKDLLKAETSARTKSDEDLNAKIKAEQTRAEGKEKEISDKLAIVDGDSNTEGSFRKAIADKLAGAGNDDLHTALTNEVNRAIGVENDLKNAIGKKADASALGNYVLTTALN
jgi:DNA gyrase/topoisomerase IV subunit B